MPSVGRTPGARVFATRMTKLLKGSILVVDDEADARVAVADLLMHEGFEVETAGDAFKALGKLDGFAPDVVVSDLQMPGMNGLELMERLLSSPAPPRFVFLTGVSDVATASGGEPRSARHVADYVAKPVNGDQAHGDRGARDGVRPRPRQSSTHTHTHTHIAQMSTDS